MRLFFIGGVGIGKHKGFKGFIPTYDNIKRVRLYLSRMKLDTDLDVRNKSIIEKVILNGESTADVASQFSVSKPTINYVVGNFMRHTNIPKGKKEVSELTSRRKDYDKHEIFRLYHNSCAVCGFTEPRIDGGGNQVHHLDYVCNGGTGEKDNLILLCPNCHMLVHHNLIDKGFLLEKIKRKE